MKRIQRNQNAEHTGFAAVAQADALRPDPTLFSESLKYKAVAFTHRRQRLSQVGGQGIVKFFQIVMYDSVSNRVFGTYRCEPKCII